MIRISIISVVCITLQYFCFCATNSKLVEQRIKGLRELNNAVLKNTGILEKYNGQTVYIKAHLIEKNNNSYDLVLNNISSNKIQEGTIKEKNTIFLEGKVSKLPNRDYKVDIIDVFPPNNDTNRKD